MAALNPPYLTTRQLLEKVYTLDSPSHRRSSVNINGGYTSAITAGTAYAVVIKLHKVS